MHALQAGNTPEREPVRAEAKSAMLARTPDKQLATSRHGERVVGARGHGHDSIPATRKGRVEEKHRGRYLLHLLRGILGPTIFCVSWTTDCVHAVKCCTCTPTPKQK